MPWDDDEDLDVIGGRPIQDGESIEIRFLGDPTKMSGKFGPLWVVGVQNLGNGEIYELRLPRSLASILKDVYGSDISGRAAKITRVGESLDTKYTVVEVKQWDPPPLQPDRPEEVEDKAETSQ
jgi:hypothetical protein